MSTRVIYLRVDDDLADALAEAAADDLRSVNTYAAAVLETYLRRSGHFRKPMAETEVAE